MIEPFKTIPGEILEIDEKNYLVTKYRRSYPQVVMYNVDDPADSKSMTLDSLRQAMAIRKGYAGPEIIGRDDFLCHHCFPSKIDGCRDCQYQGMVKERRTLFGPGDAVFEPGFKKKYTVDEVVLGYKWKTRVDGEVYTSRLDSMSDFRRFHDYIQKIGAEQFRRYQSKILCHLYMITGEYPSRLSFFSGDELRTVKRKHYLLDLEQLGYICSELCIYREGSWECCDCETGKLKDDIQRNHLQV